MRNRETVISELKSAIAEERLSTLRVLHLLREIEVDRHFLEIGYPTLFEFATRELGYSAGAAHRRIQSIRLLKSLPEIEGKIGDGTLSLCVAAKTQSFFRQVDQKRKEGREACLTLESKKEIVHSMVGLSSRACEAKLAAISPEATVHHEKVRPVAAGRTLIQFVADDELVSKIEKLKGLMAHQNFEGRLDRLIDLIADLALKKLDPEQKPWPTEIPTLETAGDTRRVSAPLRRVVWARDRGRCTYKNPKTGRPCESRFALELDHVLPFAWGGQTVEANLRLRCRAHNQYTARKQGLVRSGAPTQ